MRPLRFIPVLLVGLVGSGCMGARSFPDPTSQGPVPQAAERVLPSAPAGPGVALDAGSVHEVTWDARPGMASRLWIYTPSGERPAAGWPTVLIAPAGSSQLQGMALGDGDRAEHVVYLPAGFQVLAYEIDGTGEGAEALQQFAESRSGLENARMAYRYAKDVLPTDPNRIFAVGHSSAGSLAMLFASHESRLAGAVVYNSPGNGCWFQTREILAELAGAVPGFTEACQLGNAQSHLGHLTVPLLLFGSKQDEITPVAGILAVKDAYPAAPITLEIVETGDHYRSMLDTEVPRAIAWMAGRTR